MLDGFAQPPLVFGTHARNRCFRHPQSLCLRDGLVAGLARSSPKTLAPAATSMIRWRVRIEHAELGRPPRGVRLRDHTHVKEVNACITCMPGRQLTAQSWLRCVRTPADGGPVQKSSAHAARERGLAVRATALDRSAAAWDLQGICFGHRCIVRYLQRGVRTLHVIGSRDCRPAYTALCREKEGGCADGREKSCPKKNGQSKVHWYPLFPG